MKIDARAIALAALIFASAAPPGVAADFTASPAALRSHIEVLASDLLQGRAPGTPGFDIAAAYVASRFAELGLKPAGDAGGFLQHVTLVSYRAAEHGAIRLNGLGGVVDLVFGDDFRPAATPTQLAVDLKGVKLVFVGYGVVAPEKGRDDYAGLDVRGKIVVMLTGAPPLYPNPSQERGYYASARTKRQEAARHGAVGVITLAGIPGANWQPWATSWSTPDGAAFLAGAPAIPLATINQTGAAKLFAGAPKPLSEVWPATGPPPADPARFELAMTADVALKSESKPIETANMVGMIEGSDPKLKTEFVIMSAHLDHLGVTAPVNGDAINNGALDNASGVATLLEAARGLMADRVKPKRSIIILAVTGEEKGELGSEYFAYHPTVTKTAIIADVNLDMPILKYDFKDVVAFGAEHSSVGKSVARAAGRMGVALSPDPVPQQGIFTRSDHYRFVEQGIPSVMLMLGFQNGGEQAFNDFMATRYHRPNDDTSQFIDYAAAARFARLNYEIAKELANQRDRPTWNKGDFFGDRFAVR